MNYSKVTSALCPSATLQISALAKKLSVEGKNIISLSAGQPDFPTPQPICDAAVAAISAGRTGYTPSSGIPELKTAVAELYSKKRKLNYSPANVVVSCGAKHSIYGLISARIDNGDKVLMPKPYWVSYPEIVKSSGGVPVFSEKDITGDAIRKAVDEGVVGLIFNSPSNPGGKVYTAAEVDDIGAAVEETGIWVVSDDIYEYLIYDAESVPHILDTRPHLRNRVAVVSGVSKTWAMTGWRIGYALMNDEWARIVSTLQAHSTSNPCSISQWAALAAVRGDAEIEREKMLAAFHKRRNVICSILSKMEGVSFDRPSGAFYVFVELTKLEGLDTATFCSKLLYDTGVAVIPGSAFGAENFVRISFAASLEDIRQGMEKFRAFYYGEVNT